MFRPWFSTAGPTPPGNVTPPAAGDFASYQESATKYVGIPWDTGSWSEVTLGGTTLFRVLDLYLPSGTPPAAGWPVVCWFHANGTSRVITPGSNTDTNFLQPHLAAGFAVAAIEFPHPHTNKDALGGSYLTAYDGPGKAAQMVRSLGPAFNLDRSRVAAMCVSRGSLAYFACFRPDLADPYGDTYQKRQSSRFSALCVYNGQTLHRSATAADMFVIPADRPTFLASQPDDPTLLNAVTLAGSSDHLPRLRLRSENTYANELRSAAYVLADYIHYPDMARVLKEVYATRGFAGIVQDFQGTSNAFSGAPEWFAANA